MTLSCLVTMMPMIVLKNILNKKSYDYIMENILSPVRNVRKTYSRFNQKVLTEVQVQFADEDPTWMPYETLLAIHKTYGNRL